MMALSQLIKLMWGCFNGQSDHLLLTFKNTAF